MCLKWKSIGRRNKAIFAGFKPLMPGRIHLYCPRCRRKTSNTHKGVEDPAGAALMVVVCEPCGRGGWVECGEFYDVHGRRMDFK